MSEIPAGVKVESVFLVEAQYTADAAEKRPPVRTEHLTRVAQLRAAGTIIEAGAYSDALTSSILLVHAEGFRLREVADLLGVAEGTIKSMLHRAARKMQEQLREFRS